MIVAEELLFREKNCFEHLACKREGKRISLPTLTAQQWKQEAGGKPHTCLTPQPGSPHQSQHGARVRPRLVLCLKLAAPRENVGGSIQRYLWACLAYAAWQR